MNPFSNNDSNKQSYLKNKTLAFEPATVITVKKHTEGDDISHIAEVKSAFMDKPQQAYILHDLVGDIIIPSEGDNVIIAYQRNGEPIVVGSQYSDDDTLPPFEEGERVVGHPITDALIRLNKNGEVIIEGDQGNAVHLADDGSIYINGGTNHPITSISTSTSNGYVTSVSTTKSSDIFIP